MKKSIAIAFLLVFMFLSTTLSALELVSFNEGKTTFNATMQILLDKNEFTAGETIKGSIKIQNTDDYVIANAFIIMEIAKGKNLVYPSQHDSESNIFFEQKIANINLGQGAITTIPFEYKIPDDISSGNYRIDFYLKTTRSSIIGYPHIFASPRSVYIKINGKGEFPELKINREKTVFHRGVGPVGLPIEANKKFDASVFVENLTNKIQNARLVISMCVWDDTSCKDLQKKFEKEFTINPKETKEVPVELIAPSKPNAYAIRIELFKNNKLVSLYRNRLIVKGSTARIRLIASKQHNLDANKAAEFLISIGPTPDHYTKPMPKFEGKLVVEISSSSRQIFKKEENLLFREAGIMQEKIEFKPKEDFNDFNICVEILSKGEVYDKHCEEINSEKFVLKNRRSSFNISWNYDEANSLLELEFVRTKNNAPLEIAYVILRGASTKEVVYSDIIKGSSPLKTSLKLSKGSYNLIAKDLISGIQHSFEIYLGKKALKHCDELNAKLCKRELCEKPIKSLDDSLSMVCCLKCKQPVIQKQIQRREIAYDILPLLAIIVLVIVAIILIRRRKKNEAL